MSKRDNPAARLAAKQQTWLERTSKALQLDTQDTLELLRMPRMQSVRINPLQGNSAETAAQLRQLGWIGDAYSWVDNCYRLVVPVEEIRDSELVAAGKVFIQNAASWLPVIALDPQAGEAILDVCAAPGGKSSHIAALTNNQAELWANDNSRPRLAKMRANLDRLGAIPTQLTLYDATQITRKLDGQRFDKILLDAPCSGEGLMHYDRSKDFDNWSVAHIKRLNTLQKRLISQAWQLLQPGGTLIYSTCTMAPEENEAVVDYLLRTQSGAKLQPISIDVPNKVPTVTEWNGKAYKADLSACLRLKPSERIEAFFVAKIKKVAESDPDML